LYVGTKKQAQEAIAEQARRVGMPFVNQRWLGGMLTNFSTISGRVKKMQEYERMKAAGDFEAMPKKEALILSRELEKLARNLGGIRNMSRLPDAVFIIDTKKEHIAVTEANKLGIPIVAVVDTNCDPDLIQYVIPGNDDAIRAGTLMCRIISDAVEEGRFIASRRAARSSAAAAGPSVQDAQEEVRRSEQQREARRQAAVQAQEREARLAASRRQIEAQQGRPEGAPEAPATRVTPAPGEATAAPAEAATALVEPVEAPDANIAPTDAPATSATTPDVTADTPAVSAPAPETPETAAAESPAPETAAAPEAAPSDAGPEPEPSAVPAVAAEAAEAPQATIPANSAAETTTE
jgi:small subunit ribosomal protein S2